MSVAVGSAAQAPAAASQPAPSDGARYVILRGRDTLGVELVRWWGSARLVGEVRANAVDGAPGARIRYEARTRPGRGGSSEVARLEEAVWRPGDAPGAAPAQVAQTVVEPRSVTTRVAVTGGGSQVQRVVVDGPAMPYIAHQVGLLELVAKRAVAGPIRVVWVGTGRAGADTVRGRREAPRGDYQHVVALRLGGEDWYVGLDSTGRLRGALAPTLGISVARVARLAGGEAGGVPSLESARRSKPVRPVGPRAVGRVPASVAAASR